MRKTILSHWFFILLLLLLSTFFLSGVAKIPFHPDESTLIYMSADFEQLLSDPLSMSWGTGDLVPDVVRYRMIDAPLTRYLLGIGRLLSQNPAPKVDWDWSATWEENTIAGALPGKQLLHIERILIASLFPVTIILLYLIGIKLDGKSLGILIILVFSLNSLILLHTRRAMAEGMLIFGLALALYSFLTLERHPILVGLALAVAFNAKHSAFVLFPIGLLAIFWSSFSTSRSLSRLFFNVSQFIFGFGLLTLVLNPFLWRNPIAAAYEAYDQRQNLLAQQQEDFKNQFPAQILETSTERLMVMLAQITIAPPIFAEVGNYREETLQAESEYLQTPGNVTGRNFLIGGIVLGSILLGNLSSIREFFVGGTGRRRNAVILLLSTFTMIVGHIIMIPLSWQRYYVPLIPFTSSLAGLGIIWVIKYSRRIYSHGSLSSRLSQILAQFSANSRMP